MADLRRIWVTRAQPGADRTARRLIDLGYEPIIAPVLTIQPLPFDSPAPGTIAALAFTSVNGVTAFAPAAAPFLTRPVFTVGAATAEAARTAGFTDVCSADGDARDLARLLTQFATGHVLSPCAAQPAADLQALTGPAVRIRPLSVYEAVETAIPAPDFDAVLIHSPRAARAVVLQADACTNRLAVVISEAAAQPLAAVPFAEIRIAPAPKETALLHLLGKPRAPV